MAQPQDPSDMDDFAQTREADDLFESEISVQPQPPPTAPSQPRDFPARGERGRWSRGMHRSPVVDRPKLGDLEDADTSKPKPESIASPKNADRSLSGGLKKPKLTEDQLTERMQRMKLNNERLTERRRKAEEDENKYQVLEEERRQADATKRLADRRKKFEAEKLRREQDDEREKNAQRKLKAVQNREWDSRKTEEDWKGSTNSIPRYRRGAHGGVVGAPTTPREDTVPEKQSTPAVTEWPSLPAKAEVTETNILDDNTKNKLPLLSPAIGAGSWAEQVEAGTPTTPGG